MAQSGRGELPAGPGHDVMVRTCSACHAPEVVTGKRMTHTEWDDLVHVMSERGADATEPELAQIVDYLAAHFPSDRSPAK